ncbi:MAG: alpha/beta fold hydrolase [Muribaculaceae bacterium]|nr:alpha/beta fold hydrolase [Muribaculaceae bacterium]
MKHLLVILLLTLISLSSFSQTFPSLSSANETSAPDNAIVHNRTDSATLVGTWLMPESGKMKAALVLATGSGLQDRDETLLNHKPFRAIAERLSKEGYGILRLDDRGIGKSTGDVANATTGNFTRDIASALEWLDSVAPGVKKGVLGHSEGGLIAINLASDPKCDFIITLGAPAYPGDSIILSQARAVSVAMAGAYPGEALQKELLAVAKSDIPYDEAKEKLLTMLGEQVGPQINIPMVKKQLEMQVESVLSPWFREFLRIDPAPAIKKVTKPWLALNGEKDFQVLPVNLSRIADLNYQAECVLLLGHNHLFLECNTGLPQEYSMLKGDISEETLDTIVNWLNRSYI